MNLFFYILFLFEFCGARLCAQDRYLAKQNRLLTKAVDKLKAQNEKLQLKEEKYRNVKRENAILERKLEDALKIPAPIEQNEGRIEELLKENNELRIERDQLKSEKGRFCNEYFDEINELNEKLEESNEENGALKSQNEKLNEELEICSKKKEELYQQKRELRVERDELKAEKRRTRNQHLDEINEVNGENEKLQEENEELKRKLDALEEVNAENGKLKEENEELKRQLDAMEAPIEQNEGRIEELLKENEELRIERDQLKSEKGRFCNEYFDEINELNEKLEESKEENGELKSQNEKVNALLEVISIELEQLYQRKRELLFEQDELKAEKRRTRNEHLVEINEVNAENGKLKEDNEELKRQLDALEASSTEIAPIKTSDAILDIPGGRRIFCTCAGAPPAPVVEAPVFYLYVIAPSTDNSYHVSDWTIQFMRDFAKNNQRALYDIRVLLVHKNDNGDKDTRFPCTASYDYQITEVPMNIGSSAWEADVQDKISKFGGNDCHVIAQKVMIDDFNSRPEISKFALVYTTMEKLTDNFERYYLTSGARKGMKFLASQGQRDAFYAAINNFKLVDSAFVVAGNAPLTTLESRLDEDSQLFHSFLAQWSPAPQLLAKYPCSYRNIRSNEEWNPPRFLNAAQRQLCPLIDNPSSQNSEYRSATSQKIVAGFPNTIEENIFLSVCG